MREIDLGPADGATQHRYPAQAILAGLFLAGSILGMVVLIVSDQANEAQALMLSLAALLCAWVLHRFRQQIRPWMLHVLLLGGTLIVLSAVAVVTEPPVAVAGSAYLIWILVYASAFFDHRAAVAHGVVAGVGLWLALQVGDLEHAAAVWLIIMGTAGVAGFVVGWLSRQLQRLASTDVLTGLPNRQAFETMLVAEIDRAERENAPLAVALVDVDDFKSINDQHGHLAGDRVLARLPTAWRTELRSHDILARYGGDEFVLILPNCPLDDAEDVLTRMSRTGDPTCSVGVVTLAWGEDSEAVLARADTALYRAKSDRAVVRSDRSVPIELAVGGSPRLAHPAGASRT